MRKRKGEFCAGSVADRKLPRRHLMAMFRPYFEAWAETDLANPSETDYHVHNGRTTGPLILAVGERGGGHQTQVALGWKMAEQEHRQHSVQHERGREGGTDSMKRGIPGELGPLEEAFSPRPPRPGVVDIFRFGLKYTTFNTCKPCSALAGARLCIFVRIILGSRTVLRRHPVFQFWSRSTIFI